ncbi:MAG TPA: bifunctional hydroxymethylpyrimidine kinase/phosphomethylpyrimidine kinase, partial [Desulfocapsa sulfexigens]|nr:bifunctional hydroxymethylpyrimidine kinase/phosphomethylpyrimidine kinase [Desulfocapsa sulfexigens]
QYKCQSIVLDPVMVTRNGDRLLQDDAVQALKDHLLPMATVIHQTLPKLRYCWGGM